MIDQKTGKIFRFVNNEFVEAPVISAHDFTGKNGLKSFSDSVPNLKVETSIKFYNGKLNYQVTIRPEFTDAYQSYLDKWLLALRQKKPLPPEPVGTVKYKNPNWGQLLDRFGNQVNVSLIDADGFAVTSFTLYFAGALQSSRTNIVDTDNVTKTAVVFEGSQELTGADFVRISNTNVTYVLN